MTPSPLIWTQIYSYYASIFLNILTPALLPDFSRSLWMTSNMKMQLKHFKFDLLEMDIQQNNLSNPFSIRSGDRCHQTNLFIWLCNLI